MTTPHKQKSTSTRSGVEPSGTVLPELAARHGLTPIGIQPSLAEYIASLWERRYFIATFAKSRIAAENVENRLGQFWQVLNPLLNAAVYYLVFGVILGANDNIENYPAFLMVGVFIFSFTSRTLTSGAKAISGNLGLVRALHFPRAVLPFAQVLEEFLKTGISIAVLAVIVVLTGEPLTWQWFLLAPSLLLQLFFTAGLTMIFARLTASTRDVAQFLPFGLRIWMYMSGIMYLISDFVAKHPDYPVVNAILIANPGAVYIDLARSAMMSTEQTDATPLTWALGVAWAVVMFIGGFIYFWRAEARYGRG